MSKIDSFTKGYNLGRGLVQDYRLSRKKHDLRKIARAVPEEEQVFEDGMDQPQTFTTFLGQRIKGKKTPEQIDRARQLAMAGVIERHDPLKGAEMRAGIAEQDRALETHRMNLARGEREQQKHLWEQRTFDRQEREQKDKEAFADARNKAAANTSIAKIAQENNRNLSNYNNKLAEHNRQVAAGEIPADTPPPMRPTMQIATPAQHLESQMQILGVYIDHSRATPELFDAFYNSAKTIEKENYVDVLEAAKAGADGQKIAALFNRSGLKRIDPAKVQVTRQAVPGESGRVTIEFVNEQGEPVKIDVVPELARLGRLARHLDELHKKQEMAIDQAKVNIDQQRVGIDKQDLALRRDRFKHEMGASAREAKEAQAGYDAWRADNPNPTMTEDRAARSYFFGGPKIQQEKSSVKIDGDYLIQRHPDGRTRITDIRTGDLLKEIPGRPTFAGTREDLIEQAAQALAAGESPGFINTKTREMDIQALTQKEWSQAQRRAREVLATKPGMEQRSGQTRVRPIPPRAIPTTRQTR